MIPFPLMRQYLCEQWSNEAGRHGSEHGHSETGQGPEMSPRLQTRFARSAKNGPFLSTI